jgi:hypothetical protein
MAHGRLQENFNESGSTSFHNHFWSFESCNPQKEVSGRRRILIRIKEPVPRNLQSGTAMARRLAFRGPEEIDLEGEYVGKNRLSQRFM